MLIVDWSTMTSLAEQGTLRVEPTNAIILRMRTDPLRTPVSGGGIRYI